MYWLVLIPVSIAVVVVAVRAKRRRTFERMLRLASHATSRSGPIDYMVLVRVRTSVSRSSSDVTCALTPDALIFTGAGWGGRVCLACARQGPGDILLARPPALFHNETVVAPGGLSPWVQEQLPHIDRNGVLLQFDDNSAGLFGFDDPERWFAALCLVARVPNVSVQTTP